MTPFDDPVGFDSPIAFDGATAPVFVPGLWPRVDASRRVRRLDAAERVRVVDASRVRRVDADPGELP